MNMHILTETSHQLSCLRPTLLYCIQHKSSFLKCDAHVPVPKRLKKDKEELKMQYLSDTSFLPSFLTAKHHFPFPSNANISKTAQLGKKTPAVFS